MELKDGKIVITDEEKKIISAGCLINYYRKSNK